MIHPKIFIIIFFCGWFGCKMANVAKREVVTLKKLITAIEIMICELQYHLTPLPELCRIVSAQTSDCICEFFSKLADELERFRHWYSIDSKVYLTNLGTMDEQEFTLRDALVNARIEKLDGDKFQYDFSECENYQLDEYIVSFGDMIAASEAEEMESTGDEDELLM